MISKLDYRIWIIFCWYIVLKCFLNDVIPGVLAQDSLARNSATTDDKDIFFILDIDDYVTNGYLNRRNSSNKHLVSYEASVVGSRTNSNVNDESGGAEEGAGNNYNYDRDADASKSFAQAADEDAKLGSKDASDEANDIKISRVQKRSPETLLRLRSNFYHHRFHGDGAVSLRRRPIDAANEEVETQHEKPAHRVVRRSESSKPGLGNANGPTKAGGQEVAAVAQEQLTPQTKATPANETLEFSTAASSTRGPREDERHRHSANDKDAHHLDVDEDDGVIEEPRALPLRPIIRGPFDEDPSSEVQLVYAEQRAPIKLSCEVDLDILSASWIKDGLIVHVVDKSSRSADFRFYREPRGSLTITNVMLEDDGIWQCEAIGFGNYVENARPIRLIVLDPPKPPYLLIDSRRLDAGNIFVPVKENSELSLACISEGGNPKPALSWEVLLSPAVDRHAQKISTDVLELQEVKREMDKDPFKITTGAISEAKLPAVYRAHHNARILCVMEHPTLKVRQNASILLDVQYTPSFAITRSPGFGYPLREGIEVSLKCDVDSNPPSTPMWQKDDQDPPVPQNGDGFLNFTAIRREHSGWYKCTSRHLNFQYSSIGYFLSVRYDTVDVTSEPVEQEQSMPSSHNPYKTNQMEVELGGSVTLQCPQGSLGCWSHLDPNTARLRGMGQGIYPPTGQFSLKDVVYTDAGSYKCIGQSVNNNRKKVEILHSVSVSVKGPPTVSAKNTSPVAHPGSPLHLSVEFCANPPAYAARWLHGERIYHPGNQYGVDVLAYGFLDLPTPYCKEARLTYVHMHEKVPRQFFFVVSSPSGVSEIIFNVNFTVGGKTKSKQSGSNKMPNSIDEDEELMLPEEIHFPIFGSSATSLPSLLSFPNHRYSTTSSLPSLLLVILLTCFYMFRAACNM